MFDELKEVKHFNEITSLKNLIMYNSLAEEIKRSKSLQKAEAYLEPNQASMMELFCEYT